MTLIYKRFDDDLSHLGYVNKHGVTRSKEGLDAVVFAVSLFFFQDNSCVHATQTSPGVAQVFENLGLAHSSVDAKNLGSA